MGDKTNSSAPVAESLQKSPTKKEIDVATEALNHFAQGKRHLLVNDVQSAVNSLQEACKLLAEQHGETASQCGDAYYYYGRALLEMARVENGVLGNALDGVPEGEDADCSQVEDPEKLSVEEKDTIGKQVGDALEENFVEISSKVSTNGVSDGNSSKKIDGTADEIEMTEVKELSRNGCTAEKESSSDVKECDKSESKKIVKKDDSKVENKPSGDKPSEESKPAEEAMECDEPSKDKNETGKLDNLEVIKDESKNSKSGEVNGIDKESTDCKENNDSTETKLKNNKETEKSEDDEDNSTEEDEEGDDVEEDGPETHEAEEPEGDRTSDEEDVGNLQLAWEVLELSKVIFQKQLETSTKKMSLKIADVHLRLGEVALESENYPQSVEELNQCLDIQLKQLESTDRCLAETYYQIGVAHSFSDDFEKALSSFTSAKKVIDDRVKMLTLKKDEPKKEYNVDDDPFYTLDGEIEELSKLVGEIEEKIQDMQEMKKDSDKKMQKAKAIAGAAFASMLGGSSPSSSSNPFGASIIGTSSSSSKSTNAFGAPIQSAESSDSKATSNISHLIRKKRKPEEEAEKEEPKKVKGEDGLPIAKSGEEKSESEVNVNGNGTNGNGTKSPEKSDVEMTEQPTAEELKKKIADDKVKETPKESA